MHASTERAGRRLSRKIRVALYSGIVLNHDAVSNSLLLKLRLLQRLRANGYPIDVTAFTQATDFDDPDLRVVPHLGVLIRQPEFNDADLHVFEYAMWYELFNALLLLERPSLVVDHNTTPPDLVDDPIVKLACEKANRERQNMCLATRIATISEYSRRQLVEAGLDATKIDVLHLPPNNSSIARTRHDFSAPSRGNDVDLLFVGRFVKAKGTAELLSAMDQLWASDPDVHLTLAGSVRFSEPEVLSVIEHAVSRHGAQGRLRFVGDADDSTIARLYRDCDVFVMPSHHEGYCVPVVEALRSGCFVIGSDAGNVPNVMGDLGSTFPVGDAAAIATRITEFAARVRRSRSSNTPLLMPTGRGEMSVDEWCAAVDLHLQGYTVGSFESKLLGIIEELVQPAFEMGPGWLTRAVQSDEPILQPAP